MTKTLLIIGAGPGIGLETARRFAREGFDIVLASRNPGKLDVQIADLRAAGAGVSTVSLDASTGAAVTAVVENWAPVVDVLLYNAAALRFGPTLEQLSPQNIDDDIQLNLSSALRAIQATVPAMAAKGGGTILLTGGGLADNPHPLALTLSVGKAGLRAAAHALFDPLRDQNIHLSVLTIAAQVAPGSDSARDVADSFWQMHASTSHSWRSEHRYPERTQ